MSLDLFLAEILVEERTREALGRAERDRLVKMSRTSKGIRPFLLAAVQRLRDWWGGSVEPHRGSNAPAQAVCGSSTGGRRKE